MFRGLNSINLDPKGRLAIPSRYRQPLLDMCQGQLIITIDTEQRCLLLYPLPIWLEIEKKLANLPSFEIQSRRIQRLLIGHATEVELDSAGRIVVPPALREYAGLDKAVDLIGQGNKFELWSHDHWQASRKEWLAEPAETRLVLPDALKNLSL